MNSYSGEKSSQSPINISISQDVFFLLIQVFMDVNLEPDRGSHRECWEKL